ncbi:Protein argonaute 4A [Ranunculus cassubicifolius]
MGSPGPEELGALPPPPPLAPNVVPLRADGSQEIKVFKSKRVPMARIGFARRGTPISLCTNHFKVNVASVDGDFYHYSVSLAYEDDRPVEGKGIGRKVIDKLYQTYSSEMAGKDLAYDGEKTLFTVGPLPNNKNEFVVVLEDISSNRVPANGSPGHSGSPSEGDRKRFRRPFQSKTFKVGINFAAKIPMRAIAQALRGQESESSQDAIRVLDIILRQNAAKQGCLLVRQSFFHDNPRNFCDLGGGVLGCRGFHSSFRATQGGLSLNMDVSTTMIIRPGPVLQFLLENQAVRDPYSIDWGKAKRALKNLRIKARPTGMEYKITGISELPCRDQLFALRQKKDGDEDAQPTEVTVFDYFVKIKHIELTRVDADMPCINVGKPKKPVFIPVELCSLVSLQRYTKSLSTMQRSSLVERSRQKPQERMQALTEALRVNNYDKDKMLRASGVSIVPDFTQIEARVLSAPKLKCGNEDFYPRNGRWNFNNKRLLDPKKVENWAIVNFSARCNTVKLWQDMIRCGQQKGFEVDKPFMVIEENHYDRHGSPVDRVNSMFKQIMDKLPGPPKFLLCILQDRKTSPIYGPWKKRNLSELGIVTQCIAPQKVVNDQYLTNVLLKINAKLGGLNSMLSVEYAKSIPLISKIPTIILGMDVSHGSPGQSDIPSIAAVVSSRSWPSISRYRAAVRTQSPKVEMIDSLFKPVGDIADKVDEGIVKELLLDFYTSSAKMKPEQIIIFRDGVSESQFNQVLNIELDQIIEACKYLDDKWSPKFTVIIAQKNHHTKFFQRGKPENVPPGTVIDNQVCHPRNNDFYMCAHNGAIGTSRPVHYHTLFDEIAFSPDDLQELVHSLSYVYQRSTTAVSLVAPVCYAHLAAAQVAQFIKFDELSETSSGRGGVTTSGSIPVQQLPRLHENVSSSMFFC